MLIKGQISYILSRPAIPNFIPFFYENILKLGLFFILVFGFFYGEGGVIIEH